MKSILFVSTLLLLISSQVKASTCNLTLLKKTASAKTAYTIAGETISKRVIEKLSTQCNIKLVVMSEKQKKALDIARLEKRLAKLKSK
jgi:hypothetical protein